MPEEDKYVLRHEWIDSNGKLREKINQNEIKISGSWAEGRSQPIEAMLVSHIFLGIGGVYPLGDWKNPFPHPIPTKIPKPQSPIPNPQSPQNKR